MQPLHRDTVDLARSLAARRERLAPRVAVTGANGKTSVARFIDHVTRSAGSRVDAAVLETPPGGPRGGLARDRVDVAVITNVGALPPGPEGPGAGEDALDAMARLADRVRQGGTLVLNADDERLAGLPDRLRGGSRRIVWFASEPGRTRVERHRAGGGTSVLLRNGWIVEDEAGRAHPVVACAQLRVLQGGAARFQIPNLLAAVAACRALGVARPAIARALAALPAAALAGRGALWELPSGGYALLDRARNAEAIEAVGTSLRAFPEYRKAAVIPAPSDRPSGALARAGRAAARHFEALVVREDRGSGGGVAAEAARILVHAAEAAAPRRPCRVVCDAGGALESALAEVATGQILVVFWKSAEDRGAIEQALRRLGAAPASGIARYPRVAPGDGVSAGGEPPTDTRAGPSSS